QALDRKTMRLYTLVIVMRDLGPQNMKRLLTAIVCVLAVGCASQGARAPVGGSVVSAAGRDVVQGGNQGGWQIFDIPNANVVFSITPGPGTDPHVWFLIYPGSVGEMDNA